MRLGNPKLILLLVAVATLGGWFFWGLGNREPKFEGRGVSSWFRQYYRSTMADDGNEEAKRALRILGTNAAPFLVKECFSTDQDAPSLTNIWKFLAQLPRPFRFPPFIPAEEIRETAAQALYEIKPSAGFILPAVTNAFAGTDQAQQRMAVYLLGDVGEGAGAATHWLLQALRSSDSWQTSLAMQSASRLGPAAKETVPELVTILTNRPINRQFLREACSALGSIGPDSAPAIPCLRELFLNETNLQTRLWIAGALCRISPDESAALKTVLAQLTREAKPSQLAMWLLPLGQIGPAAKDAIPVLLDLLTNSSPQVWSLAANILPQIGADKNTVLPLLLPKLRENDEARRYNAAARILSFDAANPDAIATLMALIQNQSSFAGLAIRDLRTAGPAATSAIPVLRELSVKRDSPLREIATRALKQIEAPSQRPH